MSNVVTGNSMSLDGFIAGPDDSSEQPLGRGGEKLFDWYFTGEVEVPLPGSDFVFKVSPESAEVIRETNESVGVLVSGRRTFDITNGWDGRHPMGVPVIVVTHSIPPEWSGEDSPFTFVTDGVERAVEIARDMAGDKDIAVGAASLVQQCLRAGLLDEVNVSLVPLLLGDGVRLFDNLGDQPFTLECTRVVDAPGVTHLRYRVVRKEPV